MIPDARQRLADARLYLVCGAISDERLIAALQGGVHMVQLRIKSAPDVEILAVAERFAAVCAAHEVPLILNDRPDLAGASGVDGVHLGQEDSSIVLAREMLGTEAIIGLSTHSPAQIEAAAEQPVDYIGVGPVHATPTKPGRRAVGAELVAFAARHAAVPFFAIGGIAATNVSAVVAAGARRVAVVRAIAEADDPRRAAAELRATMELEAGVGTT